IHGAHRPARLTARTARFRRLFVAVELERGTGVRRRRRGGSRRPESGTRSSMAVSINSLCTPVVPGASLFDHAERVGVSVPTSCNKQGKCRECIVEVLEGAEQLSERTAEER